MCVFVCVALGWRHQIIAVADTGLDMNSCFFREDNGGENIECSTYNRPVSDITKRKVHPMFRSTDGK